MTAKIRLIPESYPGADLILPLGSEVPQYVPGSGMAKYNTIARPRKRSLIEFSTEEPLQVTFSVLLDGWQGQVDQSPLFLRMYGWAARNGLPSGPTVLRTEGPIPFSNLRWKLTSIEQLEVRQRPSDFALIYADLKLTLMEWTDPDLIVQGVDAPATAAPAQEAQKRLSEQFSNDVITSSSKLSFAYGANQSVPSTQQRTVTVKQGETLGKIAARELGNANRFKEIASLNGIRDPNRISLGQILKIPAK